MKNLMDLIFETEIFSFEYFNITSASLLLIKQFKLVSFYKQYLI